MIEPYSRDIQGGCKLKRHHELIFKMWSEYKNYDEIALALTQMGCHTGRWSVGKYIRRCLKENGLPHDYSIPRPNRKHEKYGICDSYHEQIAYLRNYKGYKIPEIARELGIKQGVIYKYLYRCFEGRKF